MLMGKMPTERAWHWKVKEFKCAVTPDLLSVALTFLPRLVECLPEGDPLCVSRGPVELLWVRGRFSFILKCFCRPLRGFPGHCPIVVEWAGPARGPAVEARAFLSFVSQCPSLAHTFISGVILRPDVAAPAWTGPGVLWTVAVNKTDFQPLAAPGGTLCKGLHHPPNSHHSSEAIRRKYSTR